MGNSKSSKYAKPIDNSAKGPRHETWHLHETTNRHEGGKPQRCRLQHKGHCHRQTSYQPRYVRYQSPKPGPGRQIYDRSYYHNLLKNKNNEIVSEITKMKQEVEDINKDNTTYLTLERKYEALIKDVRKYEGELADYNLALDKFRSDTKPEDIEA